VYRVSDIPRDAGREMRTLVVVPLFHVTGCHSQTLPALRIGGAAVIDAAFDGRRMIETLERERITACTAVPAIYYYILNHPDFTPAKVAGVRWASYGGAPIAPDLVHQIGERFAGARLANGFGLTECTSIATLLPHEWAAAHADSVGFAAPHAEVAIDTTSFGQDAAMGEILIRGQSVCAGYWNKPEATAQTFADPLKVWLFWGFFFAFAIKVPMFPFHTWLPDAHTEAPTAGSVILAGVLLKMGTYGFIRFSLPLLPADPMMRSRIIKVVIFLSIVGIIYGALVCLMQKDMKRLIAYSSVSHLGFCTLGIFALTPNGLSGSVLQQINHGISTGALFLIVGVLYERRHTRMISEFGGLATPMPNFAAIYLIISLSSLGMPLLNGFIGEFTILQGAFQVSKAWAAWGSLGVVLGAAYLLWLYQRVMFGPVTQFANEDLPDLNLREYATLVPLVILAFWIGIYPKPFFALIEKPVENIVRQVNPDFYKTEHAKLPPAELHAVAAESK